MFEDAATVEADLAGLLESLARVGAQAGSDAVRVDLLTALEKVKAGCAAAQARITADLVDSQAEIAEACRERASACAEVNDFAGWQVARDAERAASCPEDGTDPGARHGADVGLSGQGGPRRRSRHGRRDGLCGVAGQVALARRVSPHRGSRHVSVALALVDDLPFVLAALTSGEVSERRAEIVVTETAGLTSDQRYQVDASLRETVGDELGSLGDRDLARRVRAVVYALDPQGAVDRCRYAETQRRVTLRPAPDAMTWLTAVLPVAQGVATLAALTRDAATATAEGDQRGKGQVMADRLVELVTGQAVASAVPVEVQVVMTDHALLGHNTNGGGSTASVRGYGPIPTAIAKDLLATEADVWVRRLVTDPIDGTLTGMDSGRRLFDGGLRRFLLARDETCRTPWCDAPIRHADHIVPHAEGGETTVANGQGLCVRCNLTKEQHGWRHRTLRDTPHTVEVETPTGHRYRTAPPPVLPRVDIRYRSPLERAVELWAAA